MLTATIIYEDNHLLVAEKPPGFLAQPDGGLRPDLLTWAGEYLARHKPGRAYVGLVHRLDRAVGGVCVLAKTSKAAARLSRQFRERTAEKIYIAFVHGSPKGEAGRLDELLVRDGAVTRLARDGETGARAVLDWRVRRHCGEFALLEINLSTGFKHQIRAQLAALGHPVVGDAKYGSPAAPQGPAIGLWAERLAVEHPTLKESLVFEARPSGGLWPWSLAV
ncbi:MAG: RluA family pseudouridine synthase [Candidatus Adiutrix sp.]|jgi:RluA family pseudouridine synthase|nr:RluA family pseudouridine synthase [Candidatus Adiutrix sp.]